MALPSTGEWWGLRSDIGHAQDAAKRLSNRMVSEDEDSPLGKAVADILATAEDAIEQALEAVNRVDPMRLPFFPR
ncbi:MAG: hypothetical protein Q8R28_08015 [Dehalococcoidia bacterium]|nr:hypothetical protein [Dehalococcoidia bacterium]